MTGGKREDGGGELGWRVREAQPEDLAAVIALERATAEAPHWEEEVYRRWLSDDVDAGEAERRWLLLAERVAAGRGSGGGGEVVLLGFVVGRSRQWGEDDVEAEIENLAVAEAVRRRGVGRQLCGELLARFARNGASGVRLEVRSRSAGAIALYRGLGFVAAGFRRGYYREPEDDAVLMQAPLCDGAWAPA